MATVTLRGKQWEVTNIEWAGAEPDVGIMSDYVDSFDLKDVETGTSWDWDKDQLTNEEDKLVNAALSNLMHEPDED